MKRQSPHSLHFRELVRCYLLVFHFNLLLFRLATFNWPLTRMSMQRLDSGFNEAGDEFADEFVGEPRTHPPHAHLIESSSKERTLIRCAGTACVLPIRIVILAHYRREVTKRCPFRHKQIRWNRSRCEPTGNAAGRRVSMNPGTSTVNVPGVRICDF